MITEQQVRAKIAGLGNERRRLMVAEKRSASIHEHAQLVNLKLKAKAKIAVLNELLNEAKG